MKPDQLMAMTAGRGVDLIGAAQREAPATVWRELLHYTGPRQQQTQVHREPEWTPQDAALACAGLDARYYAAFAFRFAGDDAVRHTLWGALMTWTCAAAEREKWAHEIEGVKALRGLVDLALLEEYLTIRQPEALQQIRTRDLWHAYFGVSVQLLARIGQPARPGKPLPRIGITAEAWERLAARPYQAVRDTIERWCGVAYVYAHQRMREEDECA